MLRQSVSLLALCLIMAQEVYAVRAIPDNNLAYPVLVALDTVVTGSGFFLNTDEASYLVRAGRSGDSAILFSEWHAGSSATRVYARTAKVIELAQ